jgi:tetratricopeptide (TPR) repeat protein
MASWKLIDNSGQEAIFERFNLHGEDDIAGAEAFLRGSGLAGDGPSLLLLSADDRGAGRRFFLDSLAWRMRREPSPPRIWHLDLTGFEPDRPNALGAFLVYQLERRGIDRAPWAELAQTLGWPQNDLAAVLVSLLLEVEDPRSALAGLEELPPWEILEKLVGSLSAEHTVVLHLIDFAQATEPLRRRLVTLAERLPRFFVAFSCFGDAAEKVAPEARHPVFRYEIEPLSQDELRLAVARRFAPEDFPDSLVEVLWRRTGGAPALAGGRLAELEDDGLLPSLGASVEDMEEALAGQVSSGLDAIFEDQPELGEVLRSLLLYGAVCGEAFPPMLLLELMGIDEETADEVVDLVDASLAEGLGWIDDLEFRHPGFPGLQVYRFAEPALAGTILHRAGAASASAAASELLEACEKRLPAFTRAAAQLHLSLARHLGPAYQRPHLERLAWWVGPEDAAELSALARGKVAAGELGFDVLWKVLQSQGSRWPPFRRLALLEACREQLEAAYRANPDPELAEAFALLLAKKGEHARARELQESVIEAASRQFGEKHPATLGAMESLAQSFFAGKEFALARGLQELIHEGRREAYGTDHPETLAALWNLAMTMSQQGEAELAKAMLERAAADMKRVFGPRHPISKAVEKWLQEKEKT